MNLMRLLKSHITVTSCNIFHLKGIMLGALENRWLQQTNKQTMFLWAPDYRYKIVNISLKNSNWKKEVSHFLPVEFPIHPSIIRLATYFYKFLLHVETQGNVKIWHILLHGLLQILNTTHCVHGAFCPHPHQWRGRSC